MAQAHVCREVAGNQGQGGMLRNQWGQWLEVHLGDPDPGLRLTEFPG